MRFRRLSIVILHIVTPLGPAAIPLKSTMAQVVKVYAASALLASVGPAWSVIAGIVILGLHGFGNLMARILEKRQRQALGLAEAKKSANAKRASRIRRLMQWLLLFVLVVSMIDLRFSTFANSLGGSDFEVNSIGRWLLEHSPIGLICVKYGGVAFFCGIMCSAYVSWRVRLAAWLLALGFLALLMWWSAWFYDCVSATPLSIWKVFF